MTGREGASTPFSRSVIAVVAVASLATATRLHVRSRSMCPAAHPHTYLCRIAIESRRALPPESLHLRWQTTQASLLRVVIDSSALRARILNLATATTWLRRKVESGRTGMKFPIWFPRFRGQLRIRHPLRLAPFATAKQHLIGRSKLLNVYP